MESEKILKNILRINFNINDQFLIKTAFDDPVLEEKFQENLYSTTYKKNLVSNLVIFLGYIATLIYILIAFNKTIYIINCAICFILAVISLFISSYLRSRSSILFNNHIQIFLSSLNMISKGFILCLYFNTDENDNVEELLRIIVYDFFSTNIYLITKLEANILISLFYFLLNFSLIILGYYYSNKNRFYFLEGFTSFCTFIIFYALRKQWDFKLRQGFAEKIKFEKYFFYTVDYLDGLNGYNLNVRNKRMIFFGTKINSLITRLLDEKFLLDRNSFKEKEIPEIEKNNNEPRMVDKELNNNIIFKNNSSLKIRKNKSESKFSIEEFENINNFNNKDNLTISFLKKLMFYKKYEIMSPTDSNYNINENLINTNSNQNLENLIFVIIIIRKRVFYMKFFDNILIKYMYYPYIHHLFNF